MQERAPVFAIYGASQWNAEGRGQKDSAPASGSEHTVVGC